jgi:hypothetical protein
MGACVYKTGATFPRKETLHVGVGHWVRCDGEVDSHLGGDLLSLVTLAELVSWTRKEWFVSTDHSRDCRESSHELGAGGFCASVVWIVSTEELRRRWISVA